MWNNNATMIVENSSNSKIEVPTHTQMIKKNKRRISPPAKPKAK